MYSRNTVRKSSQGALHPITSVKRNDDREKQVSDSDRQIDSNPREVNTTPILPEPPINYGGVMYDEKIYQSLSNGNEVNAERINRLVKNDKSYYDYEQLARKKEYMRKKSKSLGDEKAESIPDEAQFEQTVAKPTPSVEQTKNGIGNIISALGNKNFSPEDLLICAMILLMLNSNSEDDILMIIVLMALL